MERLHSRARNAVTKGLGSYDKEEKDSDEADSDHQGARNVAPRIYRLAAEDDGSFKSGEGEKSKHRSASDSGNVCARRNGKDAEAELLCARRSADADTNKNDDAQDRNQDRPCDFNP